MYVYMYKYIHIDVYIYKYIHICLHISRTFLAAHIYWRRGICISNSAHANDGTAKRPIYTKRDLHIPKETYDRDLFIRECHQQ